MFLRRVLPALGHDPAHPFVFMRWVLILNPAFLRDPSGFALAKKANPGGQQPTGDKSAQADENNFPPDQSQNPIGNGPAHNGVASHDEKEVKGANEQEPAEAAAIPPDKPKVGPDSGTEILVMQGE